MPNFGETMPTESTTEKQPIKSTETDVDLRDIMGRPSVEDDSLNKLENKGMTDNEKLALKWIEKNEIEEGTRLNYNGMMASVSKIDLAEKTISLEFDEPFEDHNKDISFKIIGERIDFVEKLVKVKKPEEN